MDQETQAIVNLYQDPTLTIGAIVRVLLAQMIEQFAELRSAWGGFEQLNQAGVVVDEAQAQSIVLQYFQTAMGEETTRVRIVWDVRDPVGRAANDQAFNPIAMVMGAMMIFFGFFTGAATAELTSRGDERGNSHAFSPHLP